MRGGAVPVVPLILHLVQAARRRPPAAAAAPRVLGGDGSYAMPAWSPDGSRIVFHARRKDDKTKAFPSRHVWTAASDGSGLKRITDGGKDEYHASLSPDG